MTRRLSCSMTVDSVIDGTKTVTRRHIDSWKTLKPGDHLVLIEKGMGLKLGEKQRVLATVEIIDVRVEWLEDVNDGWAGPNVTAEEGLPHMTAQEFVGFWLDGHGYKGHGVEGVACRRIEWKYLTRVCPECGNQFEGRMPGHKYGSNWDWVPCHTCQGTGFVDHAKVVPL